MIHAAHAAYHHWLQVGTAVNHLRAQCLLATTYAVASLGEAAVRHARRCLSLSEAVGDQQTAFDRAAAFGCLSRSYALSGLSMEAREAHQAAMLAAEALDDGDRAAFLCLYPAA